MFKWLSLCSLVSSCLPFLILSQGIDSCSCSTVPNSSFFIGLGGSYNSVDFVNQKTYGKGTSYTPPTKNSKAITGSATGSTKVYLPTEMTMAPSGQIGYFQHFCNSFWLWGGKFNYSYYNINSSYHSLLIPQAGGFNRGNKYTPFTGNYVVQSYQQSLTEQMSFIPFLGKSFNASFLYVGLGPTYSRIKTSIDRITGFADLDGITTSITGIGNGSTYTATQWVWGGAVALGGTYFFDSNWFLDLSYSYGMTGKQKSNWGGPWKDQGTAVVNPKTGTNKGNSSGYLVTQSFIVTINKGF